MPERVEWAGDGRAFVANLDSNSQSVAIVRAMVALGRCPDLPLVAEGVETEAQLAFMAREVCGEIQDYLIGRPQPIESTTSWSERGLRERATGLRLAQ